MSLVCGQVVTPILPPQSMYTWLSSPTQSHLQSGSFSIPTIVPPPRTRDTYTAYPNLFAASLSPLLVVQPLFPTHSLVLALRLSVHSCPHSQQGVPLALQISGHNVDNSFALSANNGCTRCRVDAKGQFHLHSLLVVSPNSSNTRPRHTFNILYCTCLVFAASRTSILVREHFTLPPAHLFSWEGDVGASPPSSSTRSYDDFELQTVDRTQLPRVEESLPLSMMGCIYLLDVSSFRGLWMWPLPGLGASS